MSRAVQRVDDPTVVSRYLFDIRNSTRLDKATELDLARSYGEGCQESLNELIEANLGFVVKVAAEYRNLGIPFEDLLNEGNVGLIEAARRFDGRRGNRFITYAIWWIRKSILRALSDHARVVRIPTYHRRRMREMQEEQGPARHLRTQMREISLDDRFGESGDMTVGERLLDAGARSPEEVVLKEEAFRIVEEALDHLTEQERAVIGHRYGLAGGRPMVLKEIGAMMGISRERVRQIEVQAKARLRKVLARRAVRDAALERSSVRGGCGALRPLR